MNSDKAILRKLAWKRRSLIENLKNAEKIDIWKKSNDLLTTRPPVNIHEVPWTEFEAEPGMTLQCQDAYLQKIEQTLRNEIFQMKNFPADMVFENKVICESVIIDSGFGLESKMDIIDSGFINAYHYEPVLTQPEDIEKITEATIDYDRETTEKRLELLQDNFDGICDVELVGMQGLWFTPWDYLITLTGVTEAMIDLIERPDFVNSYVEKYMDVSIKKLNRYKELGLWSSNNTNVKAGSGGFGYTSDLAEPPKPNIGVDTKQLWGCSNAQMFSNVSSDMHWEFSLRHEIRWLENFGLNYYGCCEPLHNKIDILKKIPRLRKISMSAWANLDSAREKIGGRYVMSVKPNPATLAMQPFNEEIIKNEINEILVKTQGHPTEIVLKDISTIKREPRRLKIWNDIVMGEIQKRFG